MKIIFHKESRKTALRWLGVIALMALGVYGFWSSVNGGRWNLFYAIAVLVMGATGFALLVSPRISELTLGSFFSLGQRGGKKTPIYSIPESLAKRGQYELAIKKYEEIAANFPDEVRPHAAMIEIAILRLKNPHRGERIYRKGLAALGDQKKRDVLEQAYKASLAWESGS